VVAAGSEYGNVTAPRVAAVQVELLSHVAADGVDAIVVADVGRVFAPEVNVVEVVVMFHPSPDPVASPTSIVWGVVADWLRPFSGVEPNATALGALTKPSEPAVSVAVAAVAPAEGARTASAPSARAVAPARRDLV
jgi:hypothetical protein